MSTIDAPAARAAVVEFLTLLKRRDELADRVSEMNASSHILGGYFDDVPESAIDSVEHELSQVEQKLNGLQPLIEKIAQELDPDDDAYRFASWYSAEKTAQRIIGILDHRSLHDEIFNPRGPSLAADELHPWVWNAAVDLWEDGHHKEAVLSAAVAVEKHVQLKINSDLSGTKLYGRAFATKGNSDKRLGFVKLSPGTDAWQSAHDGAMYLGMACSQGIRNWAAHSDDKVSEQQALEYLAAFSVLARWAATAEVLSESPPT